MEYEVIVEHDEDTGHYTASVVGMPNIIVDATNEKEVLRLAAEAITFYLEEREPEPNHTAPPNLHAKVVRVTV